MDRKPYKTVILSGGIGYNLRGLLEAYHFGEIPGMELSGVIGDAPRCPAMEHTRLISQPVCVVERALFPTEKSFGKALFDKLDDLDADFVIVSDWPYALPPEILSRWADCILYPWPSLLPIGKGRVGAPLDIQRQILSDGTLPAGVSACLLTAGGENGTVLAQNVVEILSGDTPEELLRRIWQEGTSPVLLEGAKAFCSGNSHPEKEL